MYIHSTTVFPSSSDLRLNSNFILLQCSAHTLPLCQGQTWASLKPNLNPNPTPEFVHTHMLCASLASVAWLMHSDFKWLEKRHHNTSATSTGRHRQRGSSREHSAFFLAPSLRSFWGPKPPGNLYSSALPPCLLHLSRCFGVCFALGFLVDISGPPSLNLSN